jgi:predicted ester cyclase
MIDEVWNQGQFGRLGEFWVEETRPEAEQLHAFLVAAFPDLQIAIDDLIAEDDKVVTRLTFRGTHRGPFRGIEPTGRPVEFGSIRIYRLEDGKVTQSWATVDVFGLVRQLQA